MTEQRSFPDGFVWGTATAAHQVEGGNVNNDWWAWEHNPASPCEEPSGDACDQYHRYEEDLRLLADLGLGAYRFSVEWSRIEPEPGEISRAALDHYKRVCDVALGLGVEPIVTYHHFTSPRWLAAQGGWIDHRAVDAFGRFCEVVTEALGDRIARACTINEPNIVAFVGHRLGVFPPGLQDHGAWMQANEVFVAAHRRAVDAIKGVRSDLPVGLTLSMTDYQAVPPDHDRALARRDDIRRLMEDVFLDACVGDDFFGVQTYSRDRIGPDGNLGAEDGVPVLPMGYEYWPQALEATVRRAHEALGPDVPLWVTENGIGTDDDDQRIAYLTTALEGVLACLADGIDVRGYICWSLLDNFEWAFGYRPKFGIVAVDRDTQQRSPKASAGWLGHVARENALTR